MNESESNTKVEDKRYSDLEGEESRTEKEEFLLKQPEKIYQIKKKDDNQQKFYEKGLLATLKKKKRL